MSTWFASNNAPAWVQAIGSILAIVAAFVIPALQRRQFVKDAEILQASESRERLARIGAALKVEVSAALETLNAQRTGITATLSQIDEARKQGVTVKDSEIRSGSMTVSDAIVYRAIAVDLGRLPTDIVEATVLFYSRVAAAARLADGAVSSEQSYRIFADLAPRLAMTGAMLKKMLDKFANANFCSKANLRLTPDEAKAAANEAGYPLEALARSRGIEI